MTRIITSTYRYNPPPRKKQAVPLTGPAVVTTKNSRRPVLVEAAAELNTRSASPKKADEAAQSVARPAANDDRKLAIVTTAGKKPSKLRGEQMSASGSDAQEDRSAAAPSAVVATASRKHRSKDGPTLPMELTLSRKPVEREGDGYKRLKAAIAQRLRGETN